MSSFRKYLHTVSKDKWNLSKEAFKWLHVHKIIKDSKNENVPCSKIDEVTIQAVAFFFDNFMFLYIDWAFPVD